MRMRVLGVCVALVCPFLVFSESRPALTGYFLSGNQLYDLCNSDEGSPQVGHCLAYVQGIVDAFELTKFACVPDNITVGQAVDVVMKYLRSHPESRHYVSASEARLALRQAFPCK
jgi:hypothetical protein